MEKGQPVMNRLSRRNGVTKPRKSLHNNIEETLSVSDTVEKSEETELKQA